MEVKCRNDLGREDLKFNFLKTIIVRFDFSGILQTELEGAISAIKKVLLEKGYDRCSVELATEMDFQLDDPEKVEMEGLPIQGIRRQQVYVFKNQKDGIILKVSPFFAFVFIEKTHYINFKEYSDTLIKVVKIIRENISFFNSTRFGLRKINQCIITDVNRINEYFEPSYYHLLRRSDGTATKTFLSKDCFQEGDYNVNFSRSINHGEIEKKEAYQIILDSDIYLLGQDLVDELIESPEKMEPMNQLLFELYKEVLTESFIEKLQRESFEDEDIILGVEKNDN